MAEPVGLHAPSLVQAATQQLRDEILSGELAPGQRLIEDQIRLRFSISRAPLREAFRLLTQQGLVEHLPRRGARVTELSPSDVEQLFALRGLLEEYAVRKAFPMAVPPDEAVLTAVEHWLAVMRQAAATGDELRRDDAHRAFHAAVVALAGDRQLDLALEPVLLKLQRPMALNLRREAHAHGDDVGLRRHQDLVDALRSNDVATIVAALSGHGTQAYLTDAAS